VPSSDGREPERLWCEDRIDVLRARGRDPRGVAARETNDYGRTDAQRDLIRHHLATVEPLVRAGATAEIDTCAPLDEVVDALERIAGSVSEGAV
jgi:hypothetical protein